MTSDIMTTREVVALILNLTNIAELLKRAANDATMIDDCDYPVSICHPVRLHSMSNSLYRFAHRLNALVPDDDVVVGDDVPGGETEAKHDAAGVI